MNEERIRLIALDLDGTLLDSNKNIPPEFMPWVLAHPEIKVVIASGRQYYTLREQFAEISDRLVYIAENGAVVFDGDKRLSVSPMAKDDAKSVLDICLGLDDTDPMLCGLKSAYMLKGSGEVIEEANKYYARRMTVDSLYPYISEDDILKIAVFIPGFRAQEAYDAFPELPDGLAKALSGDSWIDIAPAGVDKGSALQAVQKLLGIRASESMAFGDFLNDVTMLRACDHSWAMANAHPELKAIAANITPYSNDENGVMRVIEGLVL